MPVLVLVEFGRASGELSMRCDPGGDPTRMEVMKGAKMKLPIDVQRDCLDFRQSI